MPKNGGVSRVRYVSINQLVDDLPHCHSLQGPGFLLIDSSRLRLASPSFSYRIYQIPEDITHHPILSLCHHSFPDYSDMHLLPALWRCAGRLLTAPAPLLAWHWYVPSEAWSVALSPPGDVLSPGSVCTSSNTPSLYQLMVGTGLPEAVHASSTGLLGAVVLEGVVENWGELCWPTGMEDADEHWPGFWSLSLIVYSPT